MATFVLPYSGFAAAYDKMMENVDYVKWADYIDRLDAINIANGKSAIESVPLDFSSHAMPVFDIRKIMGMIGV